MISHISLLKGSTTSPPTLPGEIWRLVFSYLRAGDLCHCALICQEWRLLVDSIDATRWKELYLKQHKHKQWKHPFWPNNINKEPKSWKNLYRQRYLASRLWLKESYTPSCTVKLFFNRNRERKKLSVGYGKPYRSIKGALDRASPYDCIYVYPGMYQDPTPLVIKFPCAIVGVDDPSRIVLTMQLEVKAESVKLENLSMKPMYPRARRRSSIFTLLKIVTGHVFVFNCNFDEGHIHVMSPGIVDIKACTFNTAFVNVQGVSYSSVVNCLFNPDRFAIFVEEPLFPHSSRPTVAPADVQGWLALSNKQKFKEWYKTNVGDQSRKTSSRYSLNSQKSKTSGNTDSDFSLSDSENSIISKSKKSLSKKSCRNSLRSSSKAVSPEESVLDGRAMGLLSLIHGVIISNVRVIGGHGAIMICRMGEAWIQDSVIEKCMFGVRCLQNSKCVFLKNQIHHCETTGIAMKDNSTGFIAGNAIFSNGEAGIDIRSNASPIIQHNEFYSGKRSGVVCLDSGKGLIRENDFHDNQEAAIYILHKGCPEVLRNNIWSGRAAGVAITEDGRGHISHNVITGMEWAGIDVRNGGNPVISHNLIQNGKSDGIVVGEGGKSVILDNSIDGNNGCGIWILDGSHPLIQSNRISNSGNSGIAFVCDVDREHHSQYPDEQIPKTRQQEAGEDADNSSDLTFDDDFIFPLAALDSEPESRFVHVSRPDTRLAQVEENTIENNCGEGILYEGKEGIVISKNKIENNQQNGVILAHTSQTSIENNTIRNNALSGIKVQLGVNSTIQGNGIYCNGEYGILTAGVGVIKENDICGHSLPSILVQSIADVLLENNRLQATKHVCVQVEEKARCVITDNLFYITSSMKEIKAHVVSDVTYTSGNRIYQIDESTGIEGDDWYGDDFLVKDLRPFKVENENTTAPFFTSSQLKTTTSQKNGVLSSVCNIL